MVLVIFISLYKLMASLVPVSQLQETLSERLLAQNVVLAGWRRQEFIQHLQDLNEHVHGFCRLVHSTQLCHLKTPKLSFIFAALFIHISKLFVLL
jgi:hypothetical protein